MQVLNWGKYPAIDAPIININENNFQNLLGSLNWIPRGMGRCYGDASLGAKMVSTRNLNRFLNFDSQTGILTAESGVTFEDILTFFVPRGWFPPVTPGTKFVSLGGALASDVHGKNHHKEGSIADYVTEFDLLTAQGKIFRCSHDSNSEIFRATMGGMGLTGLILRVSIQLRPIETSAIKLESIKANNLEEILQMFETFGEATYSMAWIDCLAKGKKLGRSILMKGEHATREEVRGTAWEKTPFAPPQKLKLNVPIDFPGFVLNSWTTQIFNSLYYRKQLNKVYKAYTDYDSFFYPLDAIHNWNRIYGKRGFTQYQFAVPKESGAKAIREVLQRCAKHRMGSFLSVLKAFGKGNPYLSFPIEGYTLTLDFPISARLFPFLDELDKVILSYGGRVYLTKDARLSPQHFESMYPELPQFRKILSELDPEGKIRSLQSERLGMHDKPVSTSPIVTS